jgi:hypothetical protein
VVKNQRCSIRWAGDRDVEASPAGEIENRHDSSVLRASSRHKAPSLHR